MISLDNDTLKNSDYWVKLDDEITNRREHREHRELWFLLSVLCELCGLYTIIRCYAGDYRSNQI